MKRSTSRWRDVERCTRIRTQYGSLGNQYLIHIVWCGGSKRMLNIWSTPVEEHWCEGDFSTASSPSLLSCGIGNVWVELQIYSAKIYKMCLANTHRTTLQSTMNHDKRIKASCTRLRPVDHAACIFEQSAAFVDGPNDSLESVSSFPSNFTTGCIRPTGKFESLANDFLPRKGICATNWNLWVPFCRVDRLSLRRKAYFAQWCGKVSALVRSFISSVSYSI